MSMTLIRTFRFQEEVRLAVLLVFGHRELGEEVLELLLVARADHQHVFRVHDDEVLEAADIRIYNYFPWNALSKER